MARLESLISPSWTANSSSVSHVRLTNAARSDSAMVRRCVRKRKPTGRSSNENPRPTTGKASPAIRARILRRAVAPAARLEEIDELLAGAKGGLLLALLALQQAEGALHERPRHLEL